MCKRRVYVIFVNEFLRCTNQYHYPCAIQAQSVFQTNPYKHFSDCDDAVLNPEGMKVNVTSSTFLEAMSSKPLPNTPEQNHHDNSPFPSIPVMYPLENPESSLVKEYESKLINNNNNNNNNQMEETEEEEKQHQQKENNNINNNIPKSVLVPTPFSMNRKPLIEIRKLSEPTSDECDEIYTNNNNYNHNNNKENNNNNKMNEILENSVALSSSSSTSNKNNNINNNQLIQRKANKISTSSSSSVKQNENKTDSSTNSKRGSKRKSDIESPPFKNMKLFSLEKRDFIRVKLIKSFSTISKGYIISLFGAQSFFDSLRTTHATEIAIDYGIDCEQFVSIYENAKLCNISIMKMILDDYSEDSPVHKILDSMSKAGTIAYIEKELYEMFIIPNGQSISNCGSFAASMERFSRNGETIAAWCLLINKLR